MAEINIMVFTKLAMTRCMCLDRSALELLLQTYVQICSVRGVFGVHTKADAKNVLYHCARFH